MKNQNFYTIKIASTKATVWLENDFAIFWQLLRRADKALFQCFLVDKSVYFRSIELLQIKIEVFPTWKIPYTWRNITIGLYL